MTILTAQQRLKAAGFDPGPLDGQWGARCDAALDAALAAIPKPVSRPIDPQLIADLKRDEGFRLKAYGDPLTGAEPWTIGYGHTGPDVTRDSVWTLAQCEAALISDIAEHQADLRAAIPWMEGLDLARQRVLDNMAFNMGVGKPGGSKGLLGFRNTLAMIERGEWAQAADAMLGSLWARQVGARAKRLAATMRTGQ